MLLFQVWFKNRRARYRKETKRYLSADIRENEEENNVVCHIAQIQEPSPCFQRNTVAIPYYCSYNELLEPLIHCGLPSEMLPRCNGYHSLPHTSNHAGSHPHFGHTWSG